MKYRKKPIINKSNVYFRFTELGQKFINMKDKLEFILIFIGKSV